MKKDYSSRGTEWYILINDVAVYLICKEITHEIVNNPNTIDD